jgi:predicted N-acyltransferase
LQPIREREVRRFPSIHEIPESVWDGLLEDHPYNAHRLIRAVEDARVENSRFWALLFCDDGRPVGSAMLSAFTVSLDIFLGKGLQKFAAFVRRRFPRFLRIDVLFCGLPASLGQNNLVLSDGVLELLVREMESIARESGLRFLCIKEFKQHELPQVEGLERLGFFRGYSVPYMSMEIRWRSFDEYLASLRHSYRRHIRRSMAKLGTTRLVLGGPEVVSPECFFQLYCNVMERSETRLEMLNQEFFERLWVELGSDLQVLAAMAGDEVLGAALLLKSGTTLNFMLVGLPATRQTTADIYFNLLYAVVDQAIRQGCTRLNLGQTAYWGKQQLGGEPEDEFLFFKASNRSVHAVLRALRRILFPRLRLKSPRVFK